ncbi:hypothetical protein [Gordonia sihwensis]|uniref:hypothetical protein n=1 Tax=Gordonia sihwensis TaxID=173559 RepID=UPI000344C690|nr:hypothetical protein [Gordonia sihwensis]
MEPRRTITEPAVRRAPMVVVLAGYLVALGILMAVRGAVEPRGFAYWVGAGCGLALYTAAFAVTLSPPPGRFGRSPALVAIGLTLVAQAVVWVAVAADGVTDAHAYLPMFVTAFVLETLLVFRSRAVIAWVGALSGIALGLVLGAVTGATHWWSTVQTTTAVLLAAATAATAMLSPLFRELDALAARHERASDEEGAGKAALLAREERIARIDGRVRPLLENVLDADQVTGADVRTARLIEALLRDGIRAPSFDTSEVRRAVWRARDRGVSVTLLDDGGLSEVTVDEAAVILAQVSTVLCAELDALSEGEVVARVAPPGRCPVASVTVAHGGTRRRVEFSGGRTRVVES